MCWTINILISIFAFGYFIHETSSQTICKPLDGFCKGKNCDVEHKCENGTCQQDGTCLCNPCYSGDTCGVLEDKHYPYFLKEEETIFVDPSHKGLIYQADAHDEDRYKTCLPGSTFPCPCGKIFYEIIGEIGDESAAEKFEVNYVTGDVSVRKGAKLKGGEIYKIDVAASNYHDDEGFDNSILSIDLLKLKILVQESNSMDEFLREAELEDIEKGKKKYTAEANAVEENEETIDDSYSNERRVKRAAIGSEISDTNLTLTVTSGGEGTQYPGNSTDYEVRVILPKITSDKAMDFKIEVYVMDTLTGITTFSLCSVKVESVGDSSNKIMKQSDNSVLVPEDVQITNERNEFITSVSDRAILNFGVIYNTDEVGTSGFEPSTIIVSFTTVLIPNEEFTNETAIVTAGAEYDSEQFVWVSQAEFNYSHDKAVFGANVSACGPDSIPVDGAAQFDIDAYITHAFETIEVEIFSPNNIYDKFSITSLRLVYKGDNHACIDSVQNSTFYKSVSGETNHRARLNFDIMAKDGKVGDVIDEANKITISFTVQNHDAKEGETIKIGAGMLIGSDTIWTAHSEVLIEAPASYSPSPPTAMEGTPLDKRNATPSVYPNQAAVFSIKLSIAPSLTQITCTATPGSTSNSICGVMYGPSGKYAASFPDLLKAVEYKEDGSASWDVNILYGLTDTTHQTKDDTQDFITFEITVTYGDPASSGDATVECNAGSGSPYTMSVESGSLEVLDITGNATVIGIDFDWYVGSQAGLLAELYFPPKKAYGYTEAILETSGDFFQTNYGAKVCSVDVLSIGRGIGCMSRGTSLQKEIEKFKKSTNDSVYDDSYELSFGPVCGAYTSEYSTLEENVVKIRVVYEIPKDQPGIQDGTYNLSVGMIFDEKMIWTGWSEYNVLLMADSTQVPYKEPGPYFSTQPSYSSNDQKKFQLYQPFMTKVSIKSHPGSVLNYRIKATSTGVAKLEICRLVILHVGLSYACIDKYPYGKQNNPDQNVIVSHDESNWLESASLDLGIVRNLGIKDFFAADISDEDAIVIGVIARGVTEGTGNISVEYNDGRPAALVEQEEYNIVPISVKSTDPVHINVTGKDGTLEFFEKVMKEIEIHIFVPNGYDKYARLDIANPSPETLSVCYSAVAWVGANVPCIIPFLTNSTDDPADPTIIQIQFGRICYLDVSDNQTESIIKVWVGVMPKEGSSTESFTYTYYDGNDMESVAESIAAVTVTVTKSADAFVLGNFSYDEVNITATDDSITEVEPGLELWYGINIYLPPHMTVPVEFGVMTTSFEGQAAATVHGFRWGEDQGMNIGCVEDLEMYDYELLQNASKDSVAMYHESQTDTMVADLKYLTNTGLSHFQMNPKPEDDIVTLEVHILIADHEGLESGDIITISFSIKLGQAIVVFEKNYTYVKPGSRNTMVLETEFFFTDPSITPEHIFETGEKIALTGRLRHVWNESQIEAYDARIRIMVPSYLMFVNESDPEMQVISAATQDTENINITSVFYTKDFMEFDIDFLFFTDIVEFNITLTVDPDANNPMPKGLGILEGTALMRLVCRESTMANPMKYCHETRYVNYLVQGADCENDLQVEAFEPCQFHASSAIDETMSPDKAKDQAGEGWSPAARDSSLWKHYIDIDFFSLTRVAKIEFTAVSGKQEVKTFSLHASYDGKMFTAACENNTLSPGILPAECKLETRYARLQILETVQNDDTLAIGVIFKWYGCKIVNATEETTCTFPQTALTTNSSVWRHAAHDSGHDIIYFCDYSPKKEQMACYSSTDGGTWNALPSYIGSLKGYDAATNKMYAWDMKQRALVSSEDGVTWALVDETVKNSLSSTVDDTVKSIPGYAKADFTSVTIGPWTGTFDGLELGGTMKVKWNSCCS